MTGRARWPDISLVILAKDSQAAKTRLPVSRADARELALRLAAGTIRAGLDAATVGTVLVVTSDPDIAADALAVGAHVVSEVRPLGMNRAAALGRSAARAWRPEAPVAICVADLPDVGPADLNAAVDEFRTTGLPMFVPDREETGTTVVIHGDRQSPGFGFGRGSALMHERLGYRRAKRATLALRWDLDTAEDLKRHRHQFGGPRVAAG